MLLENRVYMDIYATEGSVLDINIPCEFLTSYRHWLVRMNMLQVSTMD